MKTWIVACAAVFACVATLPAQAQSGGGGRSSSHVHESWHDSKSRIPPQHGFKHKPESEMPARSGTGLERAAGTAPPESPAPAATQPEPLAPAGPLAPSPEIVPADGFLGDLNTTSNEVVPPDTQGAVGPSHVMSVTNASVRVRQRSDNAEISAQTLDQFWAALAEPDPIVFDPRIFWDHIAGKWIFAAVSDFVSARSAVLIAISDSSDPTGTWDKFRLDADPADFAWADYPSVGFNKDWVVVQVNMFSNATDSWTGSQIFVFRKAQLAAGTLSYKLFADSDTQQAGFAQAPVVAYDTGLSAIYMVEDWNGSAPANGGGQVGVLRLSKIAGAVGSETYSRGYAFVTTSQLWYNFGLDAFEDAPQAGTTTRVDTGDARMQNCVYRNGSIWCTHTIFVPYNNPSRAALQWWRISPAGTAIQRGLIDTGASTAMHAFPSIAVNANNDAMLGYSSFSTVTYPSAHYAVRLEADAPNTFRDDTLLHAGVNFYDKVPPGDENRWGDYSATVVDPRNDADLWTVQEYAEEHAVSGDTSLWATWWGHVPSAGFTLPATLTSPLTVRFATDVGPVDDANVAVTLYDDPNTVIDGAITCKDAAGATVACTTGVRTVSFMPTAGEWLAGQKYRVTVNPVAVVPPVEAGGVPVALAARGWRASTSEQESSASATYSWRTIPTPSAFGGSYLSEHLGSAKARYTFSGTSVTWYTLTGPDQGYAIVSIDGVKRAVVDNYSPATTYKVPRTYGGLSSGTHTIEIMPSGTKRAASTNTYVAVDAFNGVVSPVPVMTWKPVGAAQASGGSYVAADLSSAWVTFTFRGTSVTWYSLRGPNQGRARVFVDGALKGTVENYNPSVQYQYARKWTLPSDGVHTIQVYVLGQRHASSTGTYICIDRFVVT